MSKKKGATEAAFTESYTVFYSGEAEKISPLSKGLLTYELGKEGETGKPCPALNRQWRRRPVLP
ncbi:TPA: hypothetical protein ACPTXZ_004562 [Escherichia coli]